MLRLGSTYADDVVTVQNPINMGSVGRYVLVDDNPGSAADRAVLAGVLSGSAGGLIKAGAGTLDLTATNTFTGAVTLQAGTLRYSADASLGAAANTVNFTGSATLGYIGNTNFTLNRTVALSGWTGTLDIPAGVTLTLGQSPTSYDNGTVYGILGKSGAGTLKFASGVSLPTTAGLKIDNGTVALSGAATLKGLSGSGGTLALGTGNLTLTGPAAYAGTLALGTNTLTLNGTAASTLSGPVSGSAPAGSYSIDKPAASTGTLTLGGNNTGLTGDIRLSGGSLTLTHPAAAGTGKVVLAGTADQTFLTDFASGTVTTPIDLGTTASYRYFSTSTTSNGQVATLAGRITGGVSNTQVVFTGNSSNANTLVLANASNSFKGAVSVWQGTLAVAADGALGDAANAIYLGLIDPTAGGLRFDGSFSTARLIDVGYPSRIDTNGNSVTLTGKFSGSDTLVKVGAGTLTLANAANSHFGVVTVSAGTLSVTGLLPSSSNAVTVASGGTLGGSGTVNRPITVSTGGALAPGVGIGKLTTNSRTTTINGGSTLQFEYNASAAAPVAGTDNDFLSGPGSTLNLSALTTSNKWLVNLIGLTTPSIQPGSPVTYTVATYSSVTLPAGMTGTDLTPYITFSGATFDTPTASLVGGNSVRFTFTPVPESATVLAVAAGGLLAGGWVRRRRAACSPRPPAG